MHCLRANPEVVPDLRERPAFRVQLRRQRHLCRCETHWRRTLPYPVLAHHPPYASCVDPVALAKLHGRPASQVQFAHDGDLLLRQAILQEVRWPHGRAHRLQLLLASVAVLDLLPSLGQWPGDLWTVGISTEELHQLSLL